MGDPLDELLNERLAELEIASPVPGVHKRRKKEDVSDIALRRGKEGTIGGALGGAGLWGLGRIFPLIAAATPKGLGASMLLGGLLGLGSSLIGTGAEVASGSKELGTGAEIATGFLAPNIGKTVAQKFLPQAFAPVVNAPDDVMRGLLAQGGKTVDETADVLRYLRDFGQMASTKATQEALQDLSKSPRALQIMLSEMSPEQKILQLAMEEPKALQEIAISAAGAGNKQLTDFLSDASNKAVLGTLDDLAAKFTMEAPEIFSPAIQPKIATLTPDFYKNIDTLIEEYGKKPEFRGIAERLKAFEKEGRGEEATTLSFTETLFRRLNEFRAKVRDAKDLAEIPTYIDEFIEKMGKVSDKVKALNPPPELTQTLLSAVEDLRDRGVTWRALTKISNFFGDKPSDFMQALENPEFSSRGVGNLARRLVDLGQISQKEQNLVQAFLDFDRIEGLKDIDTLKDFFGKDFGKELLRRSLETTKLLAERGQDTTYARSLGSPIITTLNFLKQKGLLGEDIPEETIKELLERAQALDVLGLNFSNVLKHGGLPAERQISRTASFLTALNPLSQTKLGSLGNVVFRTQNEVTEEGKEEALEKALFAYQLLNNPEYAKRLQSQFFKGQLKISPRGFLEKGTAKRLMPMLGGGASEMGQETLGSIIEEERKKSRGRFRFEGGKEKEPPNTLQLDFRRFLEDEDDIFEAIEKFGGIEKKISDELLKTLEEVESGGNPKAVSSKGALGAFQFMPNTAKWLGIDPLDPEQAKEGARKYLEMHLKNFGSLPLALAAYNWGQGNLKRLIDEKKVQDWRKLYNFLPNETKRFLAAFGYKPEA